MRPVEATLTRALAALSCAVLAAGLLVLAGCHKGPGASQPQPAPAVPGPEPFTGHLTEVDGVQAILSIRHPVLVNDDIKKLMTAVPEASALRMALFRLAPFGYPSFSDVAPGSNVGAVMVRVSADDFRDKSVAIIGFAKITEGGKIWELIEQNHLAHLKHGDWVMFGKTYAELLKLVSPDGVIAYLEKPQAEDVRLWGRVTPELLAGIRASVAPGIKAGLATEPEERRKAVGEYMDALYSMASQLHSVELSLTLADDSLKLVYAVQFLPDTPIGIFSRYKAGPPPTVTQYVSSDSLSTVAGRGNPAAIAELTRSVMDALIQVDYPPVAGQLREFKDTFLEYVAASDGGSVGVVDLGMGTVAGRRVPQSESFAVMSGHFTRDGARRYMKGVQNFTAKAIQTIISAQERALMANRALSRQSADIGFKNTCREDAVAVGGIPFDEFVLSTQLNGKEISRTAQYVGVVDGSLVQANSEKVLQAHLPALIAKTPLANGIRPPQNGDDQFLLALNGAKLVDFIATGSKVDMADPDTKAQVGALEAEFASAGPVSVVVGSAQARIAFTVSIPYKFVESSVHFGEWVGAQKINLASMFGQPAQPPPASQPSPGVELDEPMPVPLSQ